MTTPARSRDLPRPDEVVTHKRRRIARWLTGPHLVVADFQGVYLQRVAAGDPLDEDAVDRPVDLAHTLLAAARYHEAQALRENVQPGALADALTRKAQKEIRE